MCSSFFQDNMQNLIAILKTESQMIYLLKRDIYWGNNDNETDFNWTLFITSQRERGNRCKKIESFNLIYFFFMDKEYLQGQAEHRKTDYFLI